MNQWAATTFYPKHEKELSDGNQSAAQPHSASAAQSRIRGQFRTRLGPFRDSDRRFCRAAGLNRLPGAFREWQCR